MNHSAMFFQHKRRVQIAIAFRLAVIAIYILFVLLFKGIIPYKFHL